MIHELSQLIEHININWTVMAIVTTGLIAVQTQSVKSFLGKLKVKIALKLLLDERYYTLFSDVTLSTTEGTAHINQLVVSPFGVFLIDTRSMTGLISGAHDDQMWTQKSSGSLVQFVNPINQLDHHRLFLQSAFQLKADKIFSIVVFPCDNSFKSPMPNNVVNTGECVSLIKEKRQVRLNPHEIKAICNIIKPTKPVLSTEVLCPHCGHKMILKDTKGSSAGRQYWSCSNTNQCTMTLITKKQSV